MDDPYFITNISAKVDIAPNLLVSQNIYHIIKNRAKELYEKKCNPYGYIDIIYKIVDYKNGHIVSENFDGNVIFNITYTAKICYPKINSVIEARITNINKVIILAENGPITVTIAKQNINKSNFKLNPDGSLVIKDTDEIVTVNHKIKVKVIASDFHNFDNNIFIYGYLENILNDIK